MENKFEIKPMVEKINKYKDRVILFLYTTIKTKNVPSFKGTR